MFPGSSLTYIWKHDNKSLSVFCLGTKRKQFMWTQVFLTDYILRYEAVNSMSFLLTQKSTGLFSSAKMTDLATDVYMR